MYLSYIEFVIKLFKEGEWVYIYIFKVGYRGVKEFLRGVGVYLEILESDFGFLEWKVGLIFSKSFKSHRENKNGHLIVIKKSPISLSKS